MMESPFYEMTHDIQTENEIAKSSYQAGYNNGYADGYANLSRMLIQKTDEELLKWKRYQSTNFSNAVMETIPKIHGKD